MSRASCPGGSFPPSYTHQVIIITGLNKLYDYVLAVKMALDADRECNLHSNSKLLYIQQVEGVGWNCF